MWIAIHAMLCPGIHLRIHHGQSGLFAVLLVLAALTVATRSQAAASVVAPHVLQRDTEVAALAGAPGGAIVVAGTTGACPVASTGSSCPPNQLLLARRLPDGSPDLGFGVDGFATVIVPAAARVRVAAVAVQPDGAILLAGTASGSDEELAALLVRFLPDGSLDPSFAQAGQATAFASPWGSEADAIALQPDGGILVGGGVTGGPEEGAFALARFLRGGSFDPSFGEGGLLTKATVRGEFADARVRSLAVCPGGEVVAAGTRGAGPHPCPQPTLLRLGSDGAPDPAFGPWGNGVSRPASAAARSICGEFAAEAVLPSGAGLLAGREAYGAGLPLLLARSTAEGDVDAGFGTPGGEGTEEIAAPQGGSFVGVATLLGLGHGNFLLAGRVHAARCHGAGLAAGGPCRVISVSRLRPDGSIDRSFGQGGMALVPPVRLCRAAGHGARPCRAPPKAVHLRRGIDYPIRGPR